MPRPATQEERWDHERDLRKNYNPPLDAHTVAILARASTTSFDEAVALIQKFADVSASEASIRATQATGASLMAVFDSFSKERTDA